MNRQVEPDGLDRAGGVCRLFQLGLHGRLSTALRLQITITASEMQVTFRQLRVEWAARKPRLLVLTP